MSPAASLKPRYWGFLSYVRAGYIYIHTVGMPSSSPNCAAAASIYFCNCRVCDAVRAMRPRGLHGGRGWRRDASGSITRQRRKDMRKINSRFSYFFFFFFSISAFFKSSLIGECAQQGSSIDYYSLLCLRLYINRSSEPGLCDVRECGMK